jgi:hypothetical protein
MHDAVESFTSGRKRVCNCTYSNTVVILQFEQCCRHVVQWRQVSVCAAVCSAACAR